MTFMKVGQEMVSIDVSGIGQQKDFYIWQRRKVNLFGNG